MRIAFAGTAGFAQRVLARLLDTPHQVVLVLTRPDSTAGRGLRAVPSAVKRFSVERGLDLVQPASLKTPDVAIRLQGAGAQVLVVAAYGLLVPASILALPRFGAVNVHASLLPRWRGAAPIQRALLAGDRCTGVSIMKMDEALDTGPVYLQRPIGIGEDDDAGTLHEKLASLGAEALLETLAQIEHGKALPTRQPEEGVTYAAKIDKQETQLDWSRPAGELERAVRAFRPSPGARARLAEEPIKVWRAAVVDSPGEPGTLLDARSLIVACGQGALRILELQRAGGRRVSAEEFLRGRPPLSPGTRFR